MGNKISLREDVYRYDKNMKLTVYDTSLFHNSINLEAHWHREPEWIIQQEGVTDFYIEGNHYELLPGQALFVNDGAIHAGTARLGLRCNYKAVLFDYSFISSLETDYLQTNYIENLISHKHRFLCRKIDTSCNEDGKILQALGELISQYESNETACELLVRGSVLKIIALSYQTGLIEKTANVKNTLHKEVIKSVLQYLEENYQEALTAEDLSSIACMSKYHFCRIFRQHTGRSPFEYVNFLRTCKSKELLLSTNRKLIDIALDCGYNNVSYFIKMFKRHQHMTPTSMRNKRTQ